VQNDLVYFTHDGYAGLSAFAKGDASAEDRNATFVSVGILVQKEGRFGRLGRNWLLAGRLEKLAAALADDPEAVTPLDEFWQEQVSRHGKGDTTSDAGEVKGHSRARAISTVSAVIKDEESLPDYHPALSIQGFLDVFGPLVFRLLQAALLRKRILFVGVPPVRTACEFGTSGILSLVIFQLTCQSTICLSCLAYRLATPNVCLQRRKTSSVYPLSSPSAYTTYLSSTTFESPNTADTHRASSHQRAGRRAQRTKSLSQRRSFMTSSSNYHPLTMRPHKNAAGHGYERAMAV